MGPVQASYENGSLLPVKPLPLRSGERVVVIVVRQPDPARWDLSKLASSEDLDLAQTGLDDWAQELDQEDHR